MHTSLDLASVLVEILDFLEMYKQNLKPRQGFHKNRPDLDKGSAKDLLFRSRFLAMPQMYLANFQDCTLSARRSAHCPHAAQHIVRTPFSTLSALCAVQHTQPHTTTHNHTQPHTKFRHGHPPTHPPTHPNHEKSRGRFSKKYIWQKFLELFAGASFCFGKFRNLAELLGLLLWNKVIIVVAPWPPRNPSLFKKSIDLEILWISKR